EVNKRFEEVNKRFEEVNKRFEQLYAEMNKRFEEVNKRFEQLYAEMNKRFEQLSKEIAQSREDIRTQAALLSKGLENTAGLAIKALLHEISKDTDVILNYTSYDDGLVFDEPTRVEIDVLTFNPPMIIEYTTILRDEDVEKMLKKMKFLQMTTKGGYNFKMIYLAMNAESSAKELAIRNGIHVWVISEHAGARREDFKRWVSQFFGKQ
ncbi:MAG: hypothetical protein QXL15_04745, partial [Candidatus Korarchaeota archaeon]